MIQYALKCADGHTFDSWFQSASAFDKLKSAGMVSCVVCGQSDVNKAIMTPRVRTARAAAPVVNTKPEGHSEAAGEKHVDQTPGPLSQPTSPAEQAMAELRKKVEETSDFVGKDFAKEARAMHDGDVPMRSIYGEAGVEDARQLVDDGIPVAPLPFMPNRKFN